MVVVGQGRSTREELGYLMSWLAARCDGAQAIDGAGFAKNDVLIGHQLAATPAGEWDDEMLWWAYSRATKHRGQIDGWHGEGYVAAIEAPVRVEPPGGETWWRRQRRERDEAAAASRAAAAREREDEYQRARRERDERRAAEAAKPKTITVKGTMPGGGVEVRFDYPYDPATIALIRDVPGRSFVAGVTADMRDDKHWVATLSQASAAAILGLEAHGFAIAPEVRAHLDDLAERGLSGAQRAARNRAASSATDASLAIPGLAREPYPFQRAGIAYAARERRVLVADEPGLGKTLTAIGTTQLLGAYPAVVVCPASVKYNWLREWDITVPGKRVVVLDGKRALRLPEYRGADVIVTNYDILGSHLLALQTELRPKTAIIDESHYCKNSKAARTKAVAALAAGCENRLLLSGTPVLNKPFDLLAQLEILGRLDDVARDPRGQASPRWFFLKRYCDAHQNGWGDWDFDGASNLGELHDRLRATCFIRRRKADVLTELPPKTRTVIEVDLTNRAEYQRAEADLIAHLAAEAVADKDFLAEIAGLAPEEQREERRKRWHSAAERARRAEQLVRFTALKQLAVRGKMAAITQWVADFLQSGEKLVVFGWHREVVRLLAETFQAPTVMGGDAGPRRQAAVDAFQTDPAVRTIACNIIAAGEGITLTAASNSLFAELPWNPGKLDQAGDRIHRIGQKASTVSLWYILAKDSIDTEVWKIIEDKRAVVNQTTDGIEADDEGGNVQTALVQALLARMPQATAKKAKGGKR